jgi:hypothetical protein
MFSAPAQHDSLRTIFYYWLDYDAACFELAVLLGIEPFDAQFTDNKHLWCTENPINDMLANLLESMVKLGVLLKNEDIQFRFNQDFQLE